MTTIIMMLILLCMGALVLARDQAGRETVFFDLGATGAMRGFWCLVVVLVHIPGQYQNRIQDMIGSFGYIAVTFFFMTSGYAMMLGNRETMRGAGQYWKRRLLKLLVPMLLINIVSVAEKSVLTGVCNPLELLRINGWVAQLLFFQFAAWLVYGVLSQRIPRHVRAPIVYGCVMAISLGNYFWDAAVPFSWPTESVGFMYGMLLAQQKKAVEKAMSSKWLVKLVCACLLSLAFGVMYLKTKHVFFWGGYAVKVILGAVILAFMLLLNYRYAIGNPVSRFLGGISYEVFLLHYVAFDVIEALPGTLQSGMFILLSLALTVMLSWAVKCASSRILARVKI